MTLRSALALPLFLLATFLAGGIGSWATFENVRSWYPTLVKPTWNPPSWIFGPVWTTLYVLMSIAVWRVWRRREGAAALRLALAEILVLWGVLAAFQRLLWREDRVAGALWAPYLLWVSFATGLNATLWWLNRG